MDTGTSGTAPLQPRQLAKVAASVRNLREQAQSDRIFLDPAAGEEILSALNEQMTTVDGWLTRAQSLTRRTPLGQNPVGEAMSGKFEQRAGGEHDSLGAVLTPYRRLLQDAHDAVREAMQRYRQVENDHADMFRRIAP